MNSVIAPNRLSNQNTHNAQKVERGHPFSMHAKHFLPLNTHMNECVSREREGEG